MKTKKIKIDNFVWIDTDQIKEGSVLEFNKNPELRRSEVRAFEKVSFGIWKEITDEELVYRLISK